MGKCLTIADFEGYAANALDDASRTHMKKHLDACGSCHSSYVQFQRSRHAADETQAIGSDATVSVSGATGPSLDATTALGAAVNSGIDATASMAEMGTTIPAPAGKVSKQFPKIEGYMITSVLGQGGMGTVYRAVQAKLNRTVALKVLHAVAATANPESVVRFRREATSAARLHHTNIIPIYDFGESPDGYFYAMELIGGQPLNVLVRRFAEQHASSASPARLAELLQANTMDVLSGDEESSSGADDQTASSQPRDASTFSTVTASTGHGHVYFREVARWMADAADALHYAHEQDIIHRDIKPANLILSVDGRVMIADFGLAKTSVDQSMTMTGTLVGTLRYMSPEQAMAKRVRLDHRTDMYSLGATMYELLCFQAAFPGDDHNAILSAIIARDPPPPHKINHAAPAELGTICLKCLEKSPDARYPDSKGLAEDLRRYLADLPIVAKRPGPIRRAGKFVRRHKASTIAVTAAVLLAASVPIISNQYQARKREQVKALTKSALSDTLLLSFTAAEQQLEQALEVDPDNVNALIMLAWSKIDHNEADPENAGVQTLKEVDRICERVSQLDPHNAQAWYYRGTARKRLGEYSGAIEAFTKAIERFEYTTDVEGQEFASWSNLGAVYLTSGDLVQAKECLLKATEKEVVGEKQSGYSAQAWRNLAALELFLREPSAVESISKAIAANRSDVLSRVIRARIKLELAEYLDIEGGLIAAKTADDLATEEDPKAKRIRAVAHLRNDQFREAVEQAQLALELKDMPTVNHLIIATAKAKSGDRAGAQEHLETAEKSWPDNLREPGAYVATLGSGDLWIDSADELLRLKEEAKQHLAARSPGTPVSQWFADAIGRQARVESAVPTDG